MTSRDELVPYHERASIKYHMQRSVVIFLKYLTTLFVMYVLAPIVPSQTLFDELFILGLIVVAFDYLIQAVEHFRYAYYGPEYSLMDFDHEES